MLKKTIIFMIMGALLTIAGVAAFAAPAKPTLPALITSAGQSTDGLMVDVMLNKRLHMAIPFKPLAKVDDLKGVKALIVAVGFSTKGLGAAGLDTAGEINRVKALMEYAKREEMAVVLVHTGGTQRRGPTSDIMNKLVAPVAKWYVVVKAGNNDRLFDRFAEQYEAQLIQVDIITDAGPAIQNLFR